MSFADMGRVCDYHDARSIVALTIPEDDRKPAFRHSLLMNSPNKARHLLLCLCAEELKMEYGLPPEFERERLANLRLPHRLTIAARTA